MNLFNKMIIFYTVLILKIVNVLILFSVLNVTSEFQTSYFQDLTDFTVILTVYRQNVKILVITLEFTFVVLEDNNNIKRSLLKSMNMSNISLILFFGNHSIQRDTHVRLLIFEAPSSRAFYFINNASRLSFTKYTYRFPVEWKCI